jgi:hypothetical protein
MGCGRRYHGDAPFLFGLSVISAGFPLPKRFHVEMALCLSHPPFWRGIYDRLLMV